MDSLPSKFDSSIYTYTGKNVTRVTTFTKIGTENWQSISLLFSYDNMKNMYKSTNMPYTEYIYWAENNITHIRYADSTTDYMLMNYPSYNSNGYPTESNYTNSQLNPPSSGTISYTYRCD